jgi:hypothetical protein
MFTVKQGLALDWIERVKQIAPALFWRDGLRNSGYQTADALFVEELEPLIDLCLRQLAPDSIHSDCCLIRYPNGSNIPLHRDFVRAEDETQEVHTRLLVLIQKPEAGGELYIEGSLVPLNVGDAVIFRPCEVSHYVTTVSGERLMFGVGVWHSKS